MHARIATVSDAEQIAAIYNQGIAERVATFETEPRTAGRIRSWFDGLYPIVAVEDEGRMVAFAAAHPFSPRECYRGIAEASVYVAREARRRGAGRLALEFLAAEATRAGFWKLVACIFAENEASRNLVSQLGFREVGTYHKHAQLDGGWRDCVIVERLL